MSFFIIFFFAQVFGIDIACNMNKCSPNTRGDKSCDADCMFSYCNYDSREAYQVTSDIKKSDCYGNPCDVKSKWECYRNGASILGDGNCDEACNVQECGFDFGDCGYCAPSCYKSMLGGTCDVECNTTSCYYDYGACLDCSSGCTSSIWGNGECNQECNNKECNFDNGDCLSQTCAPNCYLWMLNNTICDEACQVEECHFDYFDCDCNSGCFSTLLGDGECNEICNTEACNFDEGDCGYCASGCFLETLTNGVCDEACNTFRCKYDYFACKCNDDCQAEDYGKCKLECMVMDCSYDQVGINPEKRCQSEDLVWYSIFQQSLKANFDIPVSFDDCSTASSSQCSLSMSVNFESCYSECYYRECNYGLCSFTTGCDLIPDSDKNLMCTICNGDWLDNCYSWYTDGDVLFLMGLGVMHHSKYLSAGLPDFYIYHVTSNQAGSTPSGDGSPYFPFETLDYALEKIYKLRKTMNFIYLANDGEYTLNNCETFGSYSWSYVVKTYDENKVKIKINGWSASTCEISKSVTFENVIFDGSEQYVTCNDTAYCEYCSYSTYNETNGYWYNDRNQPSSQNLPISNCKNPRTSLFLMHNAHFTLKNVEIRNFRFNFSYIIQGSGNLKLLNVNFDNVQLSGSEENAVICGNDRYGDLDINYIGGSVTRLNNGYEIDDPIDLRGFLYTIYMTTIIIRDVEFKYNLVARKPNSSLSTASLIYFKTIRSIEIGNCTFMYNYCETGVIYSKLDLSDYETDYNETNYLYYVMRTHIYIHDSRFISNYGNLGIVHIEFLYKLLNVHFDNVTFESNGVDGDSLVYIYNPNILEEYKTETSASIVVPNIGTASVILSPRWCKINKVTFTNNHASSAIYAYNLVNFQIQDLVISSSGSSIEDKNINTLLLDYFIENRDIEDLYISKGKSNTKFPDCNFMVSIINPYKLSIQGLTMLNNICRKSSPTFKIYNSDIRNLTSITCSGNIGYGQLPVCLYFTGLFDRNITNSEFIGNTNYYKSGNGVIAIEGENNIYLTNCSFVSNSANQVPLYLSGQSVYIDSSNFESNESKRGNGGGLYFISTSLNNPGTLMISLSNFTNNSANSNGGGIFIEKKSTSLLTLELLISQSNFKGNQAKYGSALYIDNSIILTLNSTIADSKILENVSKMSGAISLYFFSGILSFKSCEFLENTSPSMAAVLHIDIPQDTYTVRSKVYIDSSTFSNNEGNFIIYVDNQNRNSSVETRNCLFEYNKGIVISLNYDYFIEIGSIFRYNSGVYGTCFFLQNSAILYANSEFLNNTSSDSGGVIAMSFKSLFNCDNCTFSKNWAIKGKGGVLVSEQDSQFLISNSNFSENSCGNDGSAIFSFNCNTTASLITSSTFSGNHAQGSGVIAFISSKMTISSSYIGGNSNSGYSSGIKLIYSNANILDSKFIGQTSISGNFIYALAESNVNIQNITFSGGYSKESGGAIYSSASTVSINSSVFTDLSSPKGGAIYSAFDSTITIRNSEFFNLTSSSTGGIINANQANLIIQNSKFKQFYLTGIYGKELKKLEISDSEFRDGYGYDGGVIFCDSCNKINIKSSTFDNNSATLYGGALFLTANSEEKASQSISSCRFTNNIAQNGGAIYSNEVSLSISSSDFTQNKAISKQDTEDFGIGGGIRIGCPSTQACKFKLQMNTFTDNTAMHKGGAISWDDNLPEFANNSYTNNAAEYGGDIASYPVKLMQVNEMGALEDYNSRRLNDFVSDINLTDIASGQSIKNKLVVALVDNMNKVIATDDSSEAELKAVNSTTQISGKIKVNAVKGIFNFSEFVISEDPGSDIQIMVTSSAIDTSKIKKSGETVFSKSLVFNVNMRNCKIGEVSSGKNCEICPAGFYSLNPSLMSCLACPNTAECYGNFSMVPRPGYWRDNMYTDKFWKCPHTSACLGSPDKNNISYTGECGEMYKGNKCQSCKTGYTHTADNKCEKCPSKVNNILTTSGITLLLIIVSFLIVKVTRQSAFKPKSHVSIYIKIFLNYIQMVILASTFKLKWPDEVVEVFKIQLQSDYVHQQMYSFQCLFQSNSSQSLVYFRTLIIVALIPVFMVILSLFFWLVFKCIKKSKSTFWDDFISTCIILLFLIHPNIVKTMFASMNCTEINDGEYWLETDLDIRCWDHDHIFYVLVVSLPSIVIWGIIMPTICLVNLIRNKNNLNDISVRLRYGFLFNGYKEQHFYWEFIILYSKIILICCSVFLTRISLSLQALIVSILYSIYLRLQYSNNPYNEDVLNQMEIRAKLVCVVTIYSGLYYLMGSLGNVASYFLFILIVIANFYFLVYWAWYLLKSIFNKINKHVTEWKNRSRVSNQPEGSNLKIEGAEDLSGVFSKKINVSISSNEKFLSESQILNMSNDPSDPELIHIEVEISEEAKEE
ncbi:unnamed protein product [Blepharisma stoltei]|uniref:Uncharacterized protein n=1 Tax=Blepharisma stoltei TaxID=1481888 RepID=A0AAU9IZY5_9CILI|nr:unnamed protein product [Blepharisma stoltei]